jgi:glutamyl-tRNA synthetase
LAIIILPLTRSSITTLPSSNVAASTFNTEKLLWLNHQYIMNSDPELVAKHLEWHMQQRGIDVATQGPALVDLVKAQRERSKTLVEMADASLYFYQDFTEYDEKAAKKNFKLAAIEPLQALLDAFNGVDEWQGEALHEIVLQTAETLELKLGKVAQPLRVAVCGTGMSPSIDVTLSLLGREKTLKRLERAINYIKEKNS